MVAIIVSIYSKYTYVCIHSLPKEGRLLGWQGPVSVSCPGSVSRLPRRPLTVCSGTRVLPSPTFRFSSIVLTSLNSLVINPDATLSFSVGTSPGSLQGLVTLLQPPVPCSWHFPCGPLSSFALLWPCFGAGLTCHLAP